MILLERKPLEVCGPNPKKCQEEAVLVCKLLSRVTQDQPLRRSTATSRFPAAAAATVVVGAIAVKGKNQAAKSAASSSRSRGGRAARVTCNSRGGEEVETAKAGEATVYALRVRGDNHQSTAQCPVGTQNPINREFWPSLLGSCGSVEKTIRCVSRPEPCSSWQT